MGSILNFRFLKINCEIKEPLSGDIKINNNIAIKNVVLDKDKLSIDFEFVTRYVQSDKDQAALVFAGNVVVKDDKASEHMEHYNKSKQLPAEIMKPVLNLTLRRCNVESLKMSQVMNLPSPIPLPEVNVK